MLGRVRLKSSIGSHWDGSRDIGALGKRQSGFFRGEEHEPRAVGDEQSNNGDLLRSGKFQLLKCALLLFDVTFYVFVCWELRGIFVSKLQIQTRSQNQRNISAIKHLTDMCSLGRCHIPFHLVKGQLQASGFQLGYI